jgi:pimeloyl-ACP methyl ester carboxylesterase
MAQTFMIPSPRKGLSLYVSYRPGRESVAQKASPVLYVHGATFPSDRAVAHRFDGFSWRDDLVQQGLDVWAFDFLGYGFSDRYPEMRDDAKAHPPLGSVLDASQQIAAVVDFICTTARIEKISVLAHSRGTIAAGLYATRSPQRIDRLVFFAPITRRRSNEVPLPSSLGAHTLVTLEAQWSRFTEDVPHDHAPVLLKRHFEIWGEAYLKTDPRSASRAPPAVRIPLGATADIYSAWHGNLGYDPRGIRSPIRIVRGEWDSLCSDADAHGLLQELSDAPIKQDVKIPAGTHLLHLEENRFALYRATRDFLSESADAH